MPEARHPFHEIHLKKTFLYLLIGSVSVSALLGILAILIGDFGEFEIRILLTSLTISAASLCGLSSGAALEAKRAPGLPATGIALAILAAMMIMTGIWAEPHSVEFWKTSATLAIFAAACSHMSLLLLARLSPKYAWSFWAACVAVFGVALIITLMIWAEIDGELTFRLLGVAAILDGAITILVPIFHRLSRGDIEQSNDDCGPSPAEIEREIAQLQSRLRQLERSREQAAWSIAPDQETLRT